MTRRRLVLLAVVATGLLAVVAIVAGGRPLGSGGGKGGGLPASFWDYAFTTFLIVLGLFFATGLAALVYFRGGATELVPYQRRTSRSLVVLFIIVVLASILGHRINLNHLLHPHGAKTTPAQAGSGPNGKGGRPPVRRPRHVHFQWEELAVVLGLLVGLGVLAATMRSRLAPPPERLRRGTAPETLAAALDESLDDLRTAADLRSAIVAAYARMETALAAAGLPRRPAEAPFEYVERALLALDTSAAAVHRLTDLFEWARFSHHEPEPSMRDEAVDALVAVRDELRASELATA